MTNQRYQYCKIQKKVVPIDQVIREEGKLFHFINDEMPATKHPITGEYFTSKSKFRAVTKAHGAEEVGTAYDNGYNPEREKEKRFENTLEKMTETFRGYIRNGTNRGR